MPGNELLDPVFSKDYKRAGLIERSALFFSALTLYGFGYPPRRVASAAD